MQVVLTKDHHPLGQKGQSVQVKPGYFRNFLLPQGIALAGTKKLLARAETVNERIAQEKEQLRLEAEQLREKLNETTLQFKEKLTKKGALFAKISAKQVAETLSTQVGTQITTDQVSLRKVIKSTGNFEVNIKLPEGVTAQVRVVVTGLEEEASK